MEFDIGETMRVLVIRVGSIGIFPPAINLVDILSSLGHEVTLIANDALLLAESIRTRPNVDLVDLGPMPPFPLSVLHGFEARRIIRSYLGDNHDRFDVVWTTTDISARDAGDKLLDMCHIMQISELVESVPLYTHGDIPLKSRRTIEYAQKAFRVVVPEYNRAHIQKTWWNLPTTPVVLPNKPSLGEVRPAGVVSPNIDATLAREKRKILLYQGVYASDRNLAPFAEALEYLDGEYALYLMGKPLSDAQGDLVKELCRRHEHVHDLGFVAAPDHLSFTHYGHIGLLPYVPSSADRFSKLNALYCAPNKVWEYARFGLPMVGSDVPGLASAFRGHNMGVAVNCEDPKAIADAVRHIDGRYDQMSRSGRQFFDEVDTVEIVNSIMKDAETYIKR